MRKRQVQIPVLCEDSAHESFALGYLGARRYSRHKIRILPYPAHGRGSGKEHVRNEYLREVCATRKYNRMNPAGTYALLVMIDRDTDSQPDPYIDLDQRLTDADLDARGATERIAIFVPKRSVETWVYHLLYPRRKVEESSDYSKPKHGVSGGGCRRAGSEFSSYDPPSTCPLPSLVRGCQERSRIP